MSGRKTNLAAAAARPPAETNAPAPRPTSGTPATTTKATVYLQMHTWAALVQEFTRIKANTGVNLSMTGVGVALYDLFLEDADVQRKVIDRLKR